MTENNHQKIVTTNNEFIIADTIQYEEHARFQTYTGRFVTLEDLQPQDVTILDIAHSLSLQSRYNGHCSKFYSIAEHSVHVSKLLPKELAMYGLLHDAHEAYTGDIPVPVQHLFCNLKEIQSRLDTVIFSKFGLSLAYDKDKVLSRDKGILIDEHNYLLKTMPVHLSNRLPLGVYIEGWDQKTAKVKFLERFLELRGD